MKLFSNKFGFIIKMFLYLHHQKKANNLNTFNIIIMKTYERAQYEAFQNQLSAHTEYASTIDTPEKYGNEVYRQLKKSGYSNAKDICLKFESLIFNSFLMGDRISDCQFIIIEKL
jgi:hypothetical protein